MTMLVAIVRYRKGIEVNDFEKWVRDNWDTLKKINPYPYSNLLRAGYIAALEEVLKQLDIIYGGDFENSEIVKWIKKELKKN